MAAIGVEAGGHTFLDLVLTFCEDTGVPIIGLTTVSNQIGELKRMVNWISRAWLHIQGVHDDWRFMRKSATWLSIAGQSSYDLEACNLDPGLHRKWFPETGRVYRTTVGKNSEQYLVERDYESFRNLWLFGPNRVVTYIPLELAIGPDESVLLGPAPIAGLTVTLDFYRSAEVLVQDADIPSLPSGHDPMIIIHKAKMYYGAYWGAREVYASGDAEYRTLLRRLTNDQRPTPRLAGALA
jgi:hypothetical protein